MPQRGEHLALAGKVLQRPAEVLLILVTGTGMHGKAGGVAVGELRRQVLLDDHLPVEAGVPCQIGDAEAAGAQHRLDDEFQQMRAFRECLAADRGGFHKMTIYSLSLSAGSHLAKVDSAHSAIFKGGAPRSGGTCPPMPMGSQ